MDIVTIVAIWVILGVVVNLLYVLVTNGRPWSNTEAIIMGILVLPVLVVFVPIAYYMLARWVKKNNIMEEEELIYECQFCGKKLHDDKGYCDSKCLEADMR